MLNQPFNPLPLDELTAVFARIKGLLLTEDKVDRALQLLVQAVSDAVPGSAGAGISLFDAQGRGSSTAATERLVEIADSYTLIPEDQPGQLSGAIRRFINDTS